MATCPQCGRKLHLYDWRPECPDCKTNLIYFDSNQRLLDESEKAEKEHAAFQPRIDRAKASTIGTNKGRLRLILFFLPLLALLIPVFSVTVNGQKSHYNIVGIISFMTNSDLGKVFGLISPIVIAVILILLLAVLALAFAISQVAAGTKKGLTRNVVYSCVSIIVALASVVSLFMFTAKPAKSYAALLLNETEYSLRQGSQKNVDKLTGKIGSVFHMNGVNTHVLERAIANGEDAAAAALDRGYTPEELDALTKAIDDGKALLSQENVKLGKLSEASVAIAKAVSQYNDLETAVRFASPIKNNGEYSENSYTDLENAVKTGQEYLEKLTRGEPIVDTKMPTGEDKAEEDINNETLLKCASAVASIKTAQAGLVDVSDLAGPAQRLEAAVADGSIARNEDGNINASVGAGMFVLLALLGVQLANQILIRRNGFEIRYTPTYIGGLPSEEYYSYIEQGMRKEEIQRKMLIALAELEYEQDLELAEETKGDETA